MTINILDKFKKRIKSKFKADNISDDILFDAVKLDKHLSNQRSKIRKFRKNASSDIKKTTTAIEKQFSHDLEISMRNVFRQIGRNNERILKSGNKSGNPDVANVVNNNLSNLAGKSLNQAIESGVNLAINSIFARKSVKTFETERSKNAADEFAMSRKQQSASASVELGNGQVNL